MVHKFDTISRRCCICRTSMSYFFLILKIIVLVEAMPEYLGAISQNNFVLTIPILLKKLPGNPVKYAAPEGTDLTKLGIKCGQKLSALSQTGNELLTVEAAVENSTDSKSLTVFKAVGTAENLVLKGNQRWLYSFEYNGDTNPILHSTLIIDENPTRSPTSFGLRIHAQTELMEGVYAVTRGTTPHITFIRKLPSTPGKANATQRVFECVKFNVFRLDEKSKNLEPIELAVEVSLDEKGDLCYRVNASAHPSVSDTEERHCLIEAEEMVAGFFKIELKNHSVLMTKITDDSEVQVVMNMNHKQPFDLNKFNCSIPSKTVQAAGLKPTAQTSFGEVTPKSSQMGTKISDGNQYNIRGPRFENVEKMPATFMQQCDQFDIPAKVQPFPVQLMGDDQVTFDADKPPKVMTFRLTNNKNTTFIQLEGIDQPTRGKITAQYKKIVPETRLDGANFIHLYTGLNPLVLEKSFQVVQEVIKVEQNKPPELVNPLRLQLAKGKPTDEPNDEKGFKNYKIKFFDASGTRKWADVPKVLTNASGDLVFVRDKISN